MSNRKSSELPLRVVENTDLNLGQLGTANVCAYIEEMARALKGAAANVNQKLLAYLLGAAAQEARFQAGRIHLGK
jgi:hypothetical protein